MPGTGRTTAPAAPLTRQHRSGHRRNQQRWNQECRNQQRRIRQDYGGSGTPRGASVSRHVRSSVRAVGTSPGVLSPALPYRGQAVRGEPASAGLYPAFRLMGTADAGLEGSLPGLRGSGGRAAQLVQEDSPVRQLSGQLPGRRHRRVQPRPAASGGRRRWRRFGQGRGRAAGGSGREQEDGGRAAPLTMGTGAHHGQGTGERRGELPRPGNSNQGGGHDVSGTAGGAGGRTDCVQCGFSGGVRPA